MKVTKEQMLEAITTSNTVMEAILKLGMDNSERRSYTHNVKKYELQKEHKALKQRSYFHRKKLSMEAVFCINGCGSTHVRAKILEHDLLPFKCSNLECPTRADNLWLGSPVPIQLDHINGNNCDNRLENLRFLCLNCHGQTETYGANNYKYREHVAKKIKQCSICYGELQRNSKSGICLACYKIKAKSTINPRKLKITKEELENLLLDHTYAEIGSMFGVTKSGVARRAKTLGINIVEIRNKLNVTEEE